MSQENVRSHIDRIQNARNTYDNSPSYHPDVLNHPVYLRARNIFDQPVNPWDMADGTGFIKKIEKGELAIVDVRFVDWRNRDSKSGAAGVVKASAYIFDSKRNVVRVLDKDGKVSEINVSHYGLLYPSQPPLEDGIRMRIGSDPEKDDISVEFSLKIKPRAVEDEPPFPDTDCVTVVARTKPLNNSSKARAYQSNADIYVNKLLLLDPEQDRQKIDSDMDQIYAAVQRVKNEEVGSPFHLGLIETKLRGVATSYVDRFVAKLLQDDITSPLELVKAENAINIIESGTVQSSANIDFLKQKIRDIRKKFTSK